MNDTTVSGIIELEPQVFSECPDYASLGLRTRDRRFVEVFLPAAEASESRTRYRVGRRLTLSGGEWHIEPDACGAEAYARYWPCTVRYD